MPVTQRQKESFLSKLRLNQTFVSMPVTQRQKESLRFDTSMATIRRLNAGYPATKGIQVQLC